MLRESICGVGDDEAGLPDGRVPHQNALQRVHHLVLIPVLHLGTWNILKLVN